MQEQLETIIAAAKRDRCLKLSLDSHQLTSLPESIGDLIDLEHLNLSCNRLTSLPKNIYNLSNLNWLDLDNNQLTHISEKLCHLSQLSKLALDDNQLAILPECIGNLTKLTYLNLRNNRLSELPESIGNLANLTWLALDNNQIHTLPATISKLSKLTWLFLNCNPLSDLSRLQNLPNLKKVILFNVSLPRRYWTKFSDWQPEWLLDEDNDRIRYLLTKQVGYDKVYKLSGLTTLDLNNHQLNVLPPNIACLSNLVSLDLSHNRLNSLPKSIDNLSKLKKIDLSRNNLKSLPTSLGNLCVLNILDLSHNQLEKLPKSIVNISSLTELYLNHNKLEQLPQRISNLVNLKTIEIGGNQLSDLSILQRLPSLKYVWLFNVYLPERYWIKLSDWKPEWLLDEDNVEIRRALIEQVGYEKICEALNAVTIDSWREYTLLKIDGIEKIYDDEEEPIDTAPMVLLKMTCPSTAHIHILRVPPEMESAEAAIVWVNHGIHPDKFAIQT